MEKFYIATGKTIDLAIQAGLDALGMDRDSVSVEVLENAKTGFLGIGAAPAKVKVTYEVPDEVKPSPALSSASRSKPKQKATVVSAPKVDNLPKVEPKIVEQPKTNQAQENVLDKPEQSGPDSKSHARHNNDKKHPNNKSKNENVNKQQPKTQQAKPQPTKTQPTKTQDIPTSKSAPEQKEYPVAEKGSKEEQIEQFIQGLLHHMGSDAIPHAVKTAEDTYHVELVGENLGMLIGRRGDTLDAIQHLTNYSINRDATKRSRINVDAESYRAKREESLQRLARKVAAKVVRYRRNITLEPMNAYERHVIHATLQEMDGVSTFSTGTEPNRRVVVSYNRYKNIEDENK